MGYINQDFKDGYIASVRHHQEDTYKAQVWLYWIVSAIITVVCPPAIIVCVIASIYFRAMFRPSHLED